MASIEFTRLDKASSEVAGSITNTVKQPAHQDTVNDQLPPTAIVSKDAASKASNLEASDQKEGTIATCWRAIRCKLFAIYFWLRYGCDKDTRELEQTIQSILQSVPDSLSEDSHLSDDTDEAKPPLLATPKDMLALEEDIYKVGATMDKVGATMDKVGATMDKVGTTMDKLHDSLKEFKKIQDTNATKQDLVGKATKQDFNELMGVLDEFE